jgi:hypothetical protein
MHLDHFLTHSGVLLGLIMLFMYGGCFTIMIGWPRNLYRAMTVGLGLVALSWAMIAVVAAVHLICQI